MLINKSARGPVRCLIIAPAPVAETWVGGITNFIRGFVEHMPDDFEVDICGVSLGRETTHSGWQKLELAGREVRFLSVGSIESARSGRRVPVKARTFMGLLRARSALRATGDVIQVHSPAMDLALMGRSGPTIRVVHNAPDNLAAVGAGSVWRHFGWALRTAENHTFRSAQSVYFVDRPTYDSYVGRPGAEASKMHYLPNGVDTTLFRLHDAEARAALRQTFMGELGLPGDSPWLLYAGRLDHQKDPKLLIRTFASARAADALSNAQLLIVGEGPLRAEAEALAANLGVAATCHFLGPWPRERLAELMSAADALIMTSAYEGAPFVVLEALAAGLPVVSTRVGDVPRLVAHGSTGWLADTREPADLASGLAWVLDQPRSVISARCATSMEPYRLETVLAPFYAEHRRLADLAR